MYDMRFKILTRKISNAGLYKPMLFHYNHRFHSTFIIKDRCSELIVKEGLKLVSGEMDWTESGIN